MSNRHARHSPSPSSLPQQHASKLPKFLQKQVNRDRSKSMTDPTASPSTTSIASSSSASTSPDISSTSTSRQSRKSTKFLGVKDKEKDDNPRRSIEAISPDNHANSNDEMEEPPVIIEPIAINRPRNYSDRPLSSISDIPHQHTSLYSSTSSTSRIGDLPTRLSGWFSHTFSSSSTDLSLPSLLAQQQTASSPKSKGATALLTAAKHGKGHLDKAMRYLLDSDSTPDKCTDPIWLLGVQHPGYEPPPPPPPPVLSASVSMRSRRGSSSSPPSFRSSTSSNSNASATELSTSQSSSKLPHPSANWPPLFYADFTSRIWLTYRSHFSPIQDMRLADLCGDASEVASSPTTVKSRPWNWGGEKGWTSDSGWGCMLRTGQSLLANALIHLHLGRDWRRPPYPVHTADYALYVQVITWFLDTPSSEAPFSVHRMALAGKELGKDVGQWFGPSTAAGAIKTLVNNFPECGLGVAIATDGVLYQSDIYAASNTHPSLSPRRHVKAVWADRPVLVLLGVRLGIDGVNPIYYDTIKLLYTFPQSVGIAGGRPSSSYYFVGSQADNLFYLDPHHARPAIPFRPAPPLSSHRELTPESDREVPRSRTQRSPTSNSQNHRAPTSPSSVRTGSSTFSYHAPVSPSPLQQEFSTSSTSSSNNRHSRSPPQSHQHLRWHSSSQPGSSGVSSEMDLRELTGFGPGGSPTTDEGLNPVQEHYVTAYSGAELKTFHCERVRKMPLTGLDPSMLIGFLCKDKADWLDLRKRVGGLPRMVFSIQDEPPTWPSDSDDNMGLESISEPDDIDMDIDEEDGEAEQFFDTRSGSASTSSASASQHERSERSKSEEVETEEDPVDPITPGPGSRFEFAGQIELGKGIESNEGRDLDLEGGEDERFESDDIEDDWVDPSLPTSTPSGPLSPPPPVSAEGPPPPESSLSEQVPTLAKGSSKNSKKGKKGGQIPVPVPMVKIPTSSTRQEQEQHYPFPVTQRSADDASPTPQERPRNSSNKGTGKRMHTARARDGGRTQSGGVKGILTEG